MFLLLVVESRGMATRPFPADAAAVLAEGFVTDVEDVFASRR